MGELLVAADQRREEHPQAEEFGPTSVGTTRSSLLLREPCNSSHAELGWIRFCGQGEASVLRRLLVTFVLHTSIASEVASPV